MKSVLVSTALCCFFTGFCSFVCSAQTDTIQARIILIGDAGELTNGRHPVVSGVRSKIPLDAKTTVIFLGDNLYKTGLPDDVVPDYKLAKAPLDSQIAIAKGTKAKVYFIPGNHDWNNGGEHGWQTIQREQYYIDILGDKNIIFLPKDGCPGPLEVSITPDVTLILMDSQWWVHPYDKPGVESDCPYKTKSEVLAQLDHLLAKNSKKLVLFAVHHTFRSYGIHGGYFTLKQHIFPLTDVFPKLYIPLPLIGSIYPITRGIFGTSEDMSHPYYAELVSEVEKVIKGHSNVLYVAGHEHSLQLIKDSGYYYIVSGSGSKSTRVSKGKNSLFASSQHGFATLEISKNKNVNVAFYTVDSNKVTTAFPSTPILNFSTLTGVDSLNREPEVVLKDSVIISASDKYKNPNGFKKTVLGTNYRQVWSTPVKFKVFNIRKEKGGLKIVSLGGGKQTRSLALTDKNGREWILRSVDKDPEKALPENLKHTLAQGIYQDLVSASFPYAPLVTSELAKATGVTPSNAEYFFVPDDPAFDIYRKYFANTVALLEPRDPINGSKDLKTTAKTLNKLFEDHDNHTDQQAYLKARLLDIVIGDYDRHFDQWKWDTRDTGKGKLYYPIPKDRDQAFFNSNALLINYLSRNLFRYLQGFKKNIPDVDWLNWEARDIDRIFLNQLSENEWRSITQSFQKDLTDEVIDAAVKKLPPEIYRISAAEIAEKLKSRRDILLTEAVKYYRFLSHDVNIIGSNQQEYFKLKNNGDSLQVIVYRKKNTQDSAGIIYNRSFNEGVTKEIRLYGLNDNDKFEIDENTSSKIKVRIIGGKGSDTFNMRGNVHNIIYDIKSKDSSVENNFVIKSKKTNVELSSNPLVNEYKPYGYTYNLYRYPLINLGYNPEDKLLVGLGFYIKTFGFRRDPYASLQKLSTLYAPIHGAYQVNYQGIFNSVLMNKDILLNAEYINPTLSNFFGFGDTTTRWAGKNPEFYRVRYKYLKGEILLRKRLNDILDISIGPAFYHYWNRYDDNKTRILGNPVIIGLDSADIYTKKTFLGGRLNINVNYINNELFPSRGITWYTQLSSIAGLNSASKSVTKITTDMTVYASLTEERKLIGIFRIGAGHIFNKEFEYFQALGLGSNNYLRGYRKDRFSGSGLFYSGLEGRVKLFQSQSYILPGDVGIIGFYDVGRVWLRGEETTKWHQSYGGGLYYAPFNIAILSATIGISDEDKLLNFSLGTKFRLTF